MPRIIGDDHDATMKEIERLRNVWWAFFQGFTETTDAASRYAGLVETTAGFLEAHAEQGFFLLNLTNPNCPETPDTPLAKKVENRAREMDGLHTMLRISRNPPERFRCFHGYDPAA